MLFLHDEFFQAGLWYITDLYMDNGQPIPFDVWVSRGVPRASIIKWFSMIKITSSDRIPVLEQADVPRQLCIDSIDNPLKEMIGNTIYKHLLKLKTKAEVTVPKIAKYCNNLGAIQWKEVYRRANKIPRDTKSKEFQYKFVHDLLVNRYCCISGN